MKQYTAENIRNIAVVGHGGSGKTTLVEALAYRTGATDRFGKVADGTTISGPLAQSGVFPRLMTDMMALGEQTGNLPGALGRIGKRYEAELNRNIKIFTTALEPILILLVALVVGFVAIAILSAVFSATSAMGQA